MTEDTVDTLLTVVCWSVLIVLAAAGLAVFLRLVAFFYDVLA